MRIPAILLVLVAILGRTSPRPPAAPDRVNPEPVRSVSLGSTPIPLGDFEPWPAGSGPLESVYDGPK